MKIGIYGGSFDPVHTGHAMVANFVAQCNVVDEVWMMVSRRNPLKEKPASASDTDRVRMVELVADHCAKVKVSDLELNMPYPSYTIATLEELKRLHPDYDFSIIIGTDSLITFPQWKEATRILKEFGVIVFPRPGYPFPEKEPAGMTFLTGAPQTSISSTLIREYARDGWNIDFFVPPEVADYIKNHHLYKR